jgi:hypothetical protein
LNGRGAEAEVGQGNEHQAYQRTKNDPRVFHLFTCPSNALPFSGVGAAKPA